MRTQSLRSILKERTRPRFSARLAREREHGQETGLESGEGVRFEKTITINRPVDDVYATWRNLENLPRFMEHVVSVTQKDDKVSHWEACSPDGERVQWDARIIEEKPDELIAWESLPDSEIKTAGSFRVGPAPEGQGTVVKVALKYSAGGTIKKAFAKVFSGAIDKRIAQDLMNFKTLMETGEVPTTQTQAREGKK